jgi:predicted chitinase
VSDILDQEAQVCLVDSLPGGLHQQTVARTQMQCEEARQSGRLYRYRIGKGQKKSTDGWLMKAGG